MAHLNAVRSLGFTIVVLQQSGFNVLNAVCDALPFLHRGLVS